MSTENQYTGVEQFERGEPSISDDEETTASMLKTSHQRQKSNPSASSASDILTNDRAFEEENFGVQKKRVSYSHHVDVDDKFPTRLHRLCCAAKLNPIKLREVLRNDPDAAFIRTEKLYNNCYPIHMILQDPEAILRDERLFDFCLELIGTNPSALLLKEHDDESMFRFLTPIWIWVKKCNGRNETRMARTNFGIKHHGSLRTLEAETKEEWEKQLTMSNHEKERSSTYTKKKKAFIDSLVQISNVTLSEGAELVLRILSGMIDDPKDPDDLVWGKNMPELTSDEVLELLIVGLTSIRSFLKTSLFIEDNKFQEIFNLSVMKHVLLEKESHGKWIKYVTEYRPERLILYFRELSKLLSDDINGLLPLEMYMDVSTVRRMSTRALKRRNTGDSLEKSTMSIATAIASLFVSQKTEEVKNTGYAGVITSKRDGIVDYLNYDMRILSHVYRMDEDTQLEAASTLLIQKIVDIVTDRAFSSNVTVLDAAFHCIFSLSASLQTVMFLKPDFDPQTYVIAETVTVFTAIYFWSREVLQLVSHTNWVDFRDAILYDTWNYFDLGTVILVLFGAREMNAHIGERLLSDNQDIDDSLRRLLAVVCFFEKIFLFHYLRILNESLAVFISSLTQIMLDLKWFIFVLLIVLSMFTHMFMAMMVGLEDLCDTSDTAAATERMLVTTNKQNAASEVKEVECSDVGTYLYFYKVVYEMMLGNWDLEEGLPDDSVYIIFILLTFVITIIMLNMLIAIASDSYVDSSRMGPGLFRIMRLNYCAEVLMLEKAMCGGIRPIAVAILSAALGFYSVKTQFQAYDSYKDELDYEEICSSLFFSVGVMSWCVATAYGVFFYTASPTNKVDFQKEWVWCGPLGFYFRKLSRAIQIVGDYLIGSITTDVKEERFAD